MKEITASIEGQELALKANNLFIYYEGEFIRVSQQEWIKFKPTHKFYTLT